VIITNKQIEITKNFDGESQMFGVGDPVLVLDILRNKLYKDPIKVVLQEYIANAFDANLEANRETSPIDVIFPSINDTQLKIRDRGNSMTKDQMNKIFTQYGVSTKRTTNLYTGGFGIGSKSAWSYTDSFGIETVTCEDNIYYKRLYCAFIDESGLGKLVTVSETELSKQDTGTTIIIPVKREDNDKFINRFRELFGFYTKPINVVGIKNLLRHDIQKLGNLRYYTVGNEGRCVVVGQVNYYLNRDEVNKHEDRFVNAVYRLYQHSIVPCFDIGEIEVSPDRHSIQITVSNLTKISKWYEEFFQLKQEQLLSEVKNVTDLKTFLAKTNKFDLQNRLNLEILQTRWACINNQNNFTLSSVLSMIGGLNVERGKLYSDEQHYFISKQPQNLPETGVILSRRSGQHSLKTLKSLSFLLKPLPSKYFKKPVKVIPKLNDIKCYVSQNNNLTTFYGKVENKKYFILMDKEGFYLQDNDSSYNLSLSMVHTLFKLKNSDEFIVITRKHLKTVTENGLLPIRSYIDKLLLEIKTYHTDAKNELFYYDEIDDYELSFLSKLPCFKKIDSVTKITEKCSKKNYPDFNIIKELRLIKIDDYKCISIKETLRQFKHDFALLFSRYGENESFPTIQSHYEKYVNLVLNDTLYRNI